MRILAKIKRSPFLELLVLVFGSFSSYLWATAIVVVKADDGYWVGADSIRDLGEKTEEVCKIHETHIGLVGRTSRAEGFTAKGEDYSLDKELVDAIKGAASPNQFIQLISSQYESDIWAQMAYLLHSPDLLTRQQIASTGFNTPISDLTKNYEFRNVFLIYAEGQKLNLSQLLMWPDSVFIRSGYRYFVSKKGWLQINDGFMRDGYERQASISSSIRGVGQIRKR
jgi:hypothetical protein